MKNSILKVSLAAFLLSISFAGAQNIDNTRAEMRGSSNPREREVLQVQNRVVEGQALTSELREEAQNPDRIGAGEINERAQQLRERVMERIQADPNQKQEQVNQRMEAARERVMDRKAELEARREEMLENVNARRVKLAEERKVRVMGLVDNMLERFMGTTEKLGDIITRLENRISEMEKSGKDVQNATLALEGSISRIEKIISEIEAVRAELNIALEGEVTAEYIREIVSSIKNDIRAAHGSLNSVVTEISN